MRSDQFRTTSLKGKLDPNLNRRKSVRRRVLLAGVIAYGGGIYCVDCTIRDVSGTGARVSYQGVHPIPVGIYLINIRERIAHEARVVWRKDQEIGLHFVRTITALDATDASLSFLSRLWHSKAPR